MTVFSVKSLLCWIHIINDIIPQIYINTFNVIGLRLLSRELVIVTDEELKVIEEEAQEKTANETKEEA